MANCVDYFRSHPLYQILPFKTLALLHASHLTTIHLTTTASASLSGGQDGSGRTTFNVSGYGAQDGSGRTTLVAIPRLLVPHHVPRLRPRELRERLQEGVQLLLHVAHLVTMFLFHACDPRIMGLFHFVQAGHHLSHVRLL